MNEEFYAVLKLVSGEELFSKVCAFDETDKIMLLLDNPIFVETIFVPHLGTDVAKINPWIKFSSEEMFIIPLDKIIMITESKDQVLIKMHKRYTKEKNKETNRSKVTPNMGYISSVSEARETLEKIFLSNANNKPLE
jgi:hypothetical protein